MHHFIHTLPKSFQSFRKVYNQSIEIFDLDANMTINCKECSWNKTVDGVLDMSPRFIGPLQRDRSYSVTIFVGLSSEIITCDNQLQFSTSEWICWDQNKTIPYDQLCNDPSKPDCADGSDESAGVCKTEPHIGIPIGLLCHFLLGFLFVGLGKN